MKKPTDYSNPKILKNYALWYYTSYYPSFGGLREKLEMKSSDSKTIDSIMSEMKSNFSEDNLLETLIQNLLDKGKSRSFIMQKLTLDKFVKNDIERITSTLESSGIGDSYLLQKINTSLKGRSVQKTKLNLIAGGFDKEIIEGLIDGNDLKDTRELLESQYKELVQKNIPKEKIIQKLIAKGFLYKDIKEVVR